MGLWNKIGSAISQGFKAGKKYITDNAGTIANIGLTAMNPVAGAGMYLARSKFGKSLWEKAKPYATKAWNATKKFASEHADTIGDLAAKGLTTGAAALDAYTGVPIASAVAHGAKKIAKHYANDDTGWGRFAKGFVGKANKSKNTSASLTSKLASQSNAADVSNGHVATGYSISSTGTNSKPTKRNYNGYNRMVSNFLG